MKIFKKLCKVLGKTIGIVAFAASIRWSKGQYENKSFFSNDNDNDNRVRLGSGEIIGLYKLNGSITSRTMKEAVLKLRAGDDRLIRCIISKVSESELDMPSIK